VKRRKDVEGAKGYHVVESHRGRDNKKIGVGRMVDGGGRCKFVGRKQARIKMSKSRVESK